MTHTLYFLAMIFIGYSINYLGAGITNIPSVIPSLMLVLGLYGATMSINTTHLKVHYRMILMCITCGVFLKVLFISALSYAFMGPIAMYIGVMLAQIDPLATQQLTADNASMTPKTKTIMNAWASFDDPMTVLLATLFVIPYSSNTISISSFETDIYNILIVCVVFLIYKYMHYNTLSGVLKMAIILLLIVLCTLFEAFLGIALIGLFIRYDGINTLYNITLKGVFLCLGICMGIILYTTMIDFTTILYGLLCGIIAFIAQIIIGFTVSKYYSFTVKDMLYIMFAQYNGLTTILLALVIAPLYPLIIPLSIVSIIIVSFLYTTTNAFLERYYIDKT